MVQGISRILQFMVANFFHMTMAWILNFDKQIPSLHGGLLTRVGSTLDSKLPRLMSLQILCVSCHTDAEMWRTEVGFF